MIIQKILQETKYPHPLLEYLALTASRRYKVYEIPKRNGKGSRTIAQPTKDVKNIQRIISEKFLSRFPVHKSATAYLDNKSIKDNAERHKNNRFLLKMDFCNFFNSITSEDLKKYIVDKKDKFDFLVDLDEKDLGFLIKILFWQPKKSLNMILSIGAPSSPVLSNVLMLDFDEQISDFCEKNSVVYTRYADDLAFSCNEPDILKKIESQVEAICSTLIFPRLTINKDKTVHSSKKRNRHITGLTITNDGNISLGHKKKIILKSLIHRFLKGELDAKKANYLKGMLNFSKGVDLAFVDRMNTKYGKENMYKIFNFK